jgi:hypothetical protein
MDILANLKKIRAALSHLYEKKKLTITEGMYLARLLNEIEYDIKNQHKRKRKSLIDRLRQ